MKSYKETLIDTLEAKRETLLVDLDQTCDETNSLELRASASSAKEKQLVKDIAFIEDLLAQLSPSEPFDYMDSDVA